MGHIISGNLEMGQLTSMDDQETKRILENKQPRPNNHKYRFWRSGTLRMINVPIQQWKKTSIRTLLTTPRSWWLRTPLSTSNIASHAKLLRAAHEMINLQCLTKERWPSHPSSRNNIVARIEVPITKSSWTCLSAITQRRAEDHWPTLVTKRLHYQPTLWIQPTHLTKTTSRWEETQSVHFVAFQPPDLVIDQSGSKRSGALGFDTNIQMCHELIPDSPSISCPSAREGITASETTWSSIKSVSYSQAPMNSQSTGTRTAWATSAANWSATSWAPMKK